MTDPRVAGPTGDGSKSLAKESKVGIALQFIFTTVVTGLLGWLQGLDTSHWSGYVGMVGVAVVGLAIGLISAYLKKNR